MQYLVERARGPLSPSPEQAISLLEQTVIPHFEYVIRLKTAHHASSLICL